MKVTRYKIFIRKIKQGLIYKLEFPKLDAVKEHLLLGVFVSIVVLFERRGTKVKYI